MTASTPHSRTGAKVAVVTGSESGIGRATALELAARGYDIGVTWYTDEGDAQDTAERVRALGRRSEVRALDLSRLPEGAEAVAELADALGRLDVLVNAAGTNRKAPFVETGFDDFRHVLAVDLEGPFLAAQHAARRMIAQGDGGRIVNVTSVHEHTPLPRAAAYTAAKHGLGGLTKILAIELAEHGITVNSVAPGLTATPLSGLAGVDVHTVRRDALPVARPGDPREVASLIGWLASDAAAYTTGASFPVDGGFLVANPQYTTVGLGAGD